MQNKSPEIHTAPPNSGKVELGRSLLSLLDEAIKKHPNPKAFNQKDEKWFAISNQEFRDRVESLALGLLEISLKRADRIAMFVHSDISFVLMDLASLTAGLVNVPIYLTHSPKNILHILKQTEAEVLAVSDRDLLKQISPVLAQTRIKTIIIRKKDSGQIELPETIENVFSYAEIMEKGSSKQIENPEAIKSLKSQINAQDLATIIYTSGTTGTPKGVMLSHENISSNVTASMSGLTSLGSGQDETALSFLPLTHIFARTLSYGLIWKGISTYYSDPERLREDLQTVKPSFFAAVPRVLDKAYERIMAAGSSLSGIKRLFFKWSIKLTESYDINQKPSAFYALQLAIVDKLVFSKWRQALGGDIKLIIVGGAALRPDLVSSFGAAKISLIEGYGLTETSPVVCFNRPDMNMPGTVGPVLDGTEVKIAKNGEILVRGPQVMQGYYKNPEETAKVLDDDGWFHTGDIGEFDKNDYLKITGRIKSIFKLSTGKYVMPQPLEDEFEAEALLSAALVIGEAEKYCSAIAFLNNETLLAQNIKPLEAINNKDIRKQLIEIVKRANNKLPHWSNIKKLLVLIDEPSIENGLLTPKMSVKRKAVLQKYKDMIKAIYHDKAGTLERAVIIDI